MESAHPKFETCTRTWNIDKSPTWRYGCTKPLGFVLTKQVNDFLLRVWAGVLSNPVLPFDGNLVSLRCKDTGGGGPESVYGSHGSSLFSTETEFGPQNRSSSLQKLSWTHRIGVHSWGKQLRICEPNLIPMEKSEPPWLP